MGEGKTEDKSLDDNLDTGDAMQEEIDALQKDEDDKVDANAESKTEDDTAGQSDQEDDSTSEEDTEESKDDNKDDDEEGKSDEDESKDTEDDESEEDEIPKDSSAAYKKANKWRREARTERDARLKLEARLKVVEDNVKNSNPKEISEEDKEFNSAKQQVRDIVKEYVEERDKDRDRRIKEYDDKVQDMIDDCYEQFGADFKEKETMDFAKKWKLNSLATAHQMMKQMGKSKTIGAEEAKAILLKKKKANLPIGGGGSSVGIDKLGITKDDDLDDITEKIINSGILKEKK